MEKNIADFVKSNKNWTFEGKTQVTQCSMEWNSFPTIEGKIAIWTDDLPAYFSFIRLSDEGPKPLFSCGIKYELAPTQVKLKLPILFDMSNSTIFVKEIASTFSEFITQLLIISKSLCDNVSPKMDMEKFVAKGNSSLVQDDNLMDNWKEAIKMNLQGKQCVVSKFTPKSK